MKLKREKGVPLTVAEAELLAECRRRYYSKERETRTVDSNGVIRVTRTVDAEPIINAMLAYKDLVGIDRHNNKVAGARMVGAIDPITALNWSKETGLKVGSKEFGAFAKKRIQNDIDYRRFRVGH